LRAAIRKLLFSSAATDVAEPSLEFAEYCGNTAGARRVGALAPTKWALSRSARRQRRDSAVNGWQPNWPGVEADKVNTD
jgi:hypothetical protein